MSALRSSAGPAVCTNGTSSSRRDDLRERRLAEAGRAGEQHVVERLAARRRGLERHAELLLHRVLADEVLERARAQRRVGVLLRPLVRGLDAVGAGRADHRRAPFSAWAIRSSGESPGAPSSSLSASWWREAEADEPVAREHPRVVAAGDHDRVVGHGADLLAQLDDDPLRRALADPGRRLQPRGVAGGDGAQQVARRAAGEHRERHLRPDRLHADQQQEEVALLLGGEAVQQHRVVTHDQVRVRRHGLPHARHVAQRLGRHRQPVADAAARDDDVVGAADRDRALEQRDHPTLVSAAASGAPLAWQIATASASAAWSGRGSSSSASSVWTIRCTWSFAARPEPHTAPLTCCGV